MRKFLIVAAAVSALIVALGVGVWMGAVYHDRLATALSPLHDTRERTTAVNAKTSQMNGADQPTPASKTLFHCGMHPWIIQDHPGNCPICHMKLTPIQGGSTQVAIAEKKILYYWDPMLGPSSISQGPGKSAMGMDLVPVYANEVSAGPAVTIDPAVVQNMGVQTATALKGSFGKSLRTVGFLDMPETGFYDITLKVNGYIDKLYADTTGMHVHKGEPLFDLYSPEWVVAEDELIAARKSVGALASASEDVRKQAQRLMESARRKLQLLDVPDDIIERIATQDHASKDITVRSPASGHLGDKSVVQGSAVQAGMKLMRIEDHSTLWLEAQVYEEQLGLVKLGDKVDATLDGIPGKIFSGPIVFIDPHLDRTTRTVSVRVILENPGDELKPGMYATVEIHGQPVEDAISVPREAVIDTGTRKIVFVAEPEGHFSPRLVTTGISGDDDRMQILSGVAPGETVVTSGQFLMDVESRTQEAIQKLQTPEPPATLPMTNSMKGAQTPPASAPAASLTASGLTDDVVKAYLELTTYLQKNDAGSKPADVSRLLTASRKLAETIPADDQPLVKNLADAVEEMKGQSIGRQRKGLEQVGAALLPLIDKEPPSTAVSSKLYVVHCPMENADWLQTQPDILNPFLPSMRICGSITRTLSLFPTK